MLAGCSKAVGYRARAVDQTSVGDRAVFKLLGAWRAMGRGQCGMKNTGICVAGKREKEREGRAMYRGTGWSLVPLRARAKSHGRRALSSTSFSQDFSPSVAPA